VRRDRRARSDLSGAESLEGLDPSEQRGWRGLCRRQGWARGVLLEEGRDVAVG
jgi:hypothetical protein